MKSPYNIAEVEQFQPDLMGFIFYKGSPRHIEETSYSAIKDLNKAIQKVGVFVKSPMNEVLENVKKHRLDLVQLHGNESVEYVKALHQEHIAIIKAFAINDDFNWSSIKDYAPYVNYFLFDTAGEKYGGSGRKFNWEQLKNYKEEIPFLLSGGIEVNDIPTIRALNISQLYGIDINSKFEIEPGLKDVSLVDQAIKDVKK